MNTLRLSEKQLEAVMKACRESDSQIANEVAQEISRELFYRRCVTDEDLLIFKDHSQDAQEAVYASGEQPVTITPKFAKKL